MIYKLKSQYFCLSTEERANVTTHGLGLILGLISLTLLLYACWTGLQRFGVLVIHLGAIFMLLSSTTYHYHTEVNKKYFWKIVDHISIFVLISCSYTPFIILYMPTAEGMNYLLLNWTIAALGVLFKLIFKDKYEIFSVIFYVSLGWMVLGFISTIYEAMPASGFMLLIIGGVCYTIGVVFYLLNRIKYNHAIWHVLVLLGLVSHITSLYISSCYF